jgi:hypothetical protein
MIEANIETVVPEWPWYAAYGAHSGLVLAADAPPPPLLELEQAASSSPAAAAPTSEIRVRLARGVMVSPYWTGTGAGQAREL